MIECNFQERFMKIHLCLALVLSLTACSNVDPNAITPYLERAPADAKVKLNSRIQAFAHFYDQLDDNLLETKIAGVYADNLYFNDTVATIYDRQKLLRYFQHTQQQLDGIEFEVLDVQDHGQDAFVRWKMQTSFKVLGQAHMVQSIGMSHLRFNRNNQIVLHQDYWDSLQGFYQHIPVIGGILRWIKNQLNDF
jgi:hypothetical protein